MTSFVDIDVLPPLAEVFAGPFADLTEGVRLGAGVEPMTIDELAARYRERDGMAVLLGWDAETATGHPPLTSSRVADLVAGHPDVFVGFGAVDPLKGAEAFAGVHEAKRLGMRGISLHPAVQRFSPTDRAAYQVWEIAQDLRLPVLVHTGFTSLGAGRPGGGGVALANADPMLLDRVAADFPDLQIVLAHAVWPWQEEAVAVALHKANVWLALSGWAPERIPEAILEAVAGPLAHRVLFGTGFPPVPSEERIAAWHRSPIPEDVTRSILADNALRLLGLGGASSE